MRGLTNTPYYYYMTWRVMTGLLVTWRPITGRLMSGAIITWSLIKGRLLMMMTGASWRSASWRGAIGARQQLVHYKCCQRQISHGIMEFHGIYMEFHTHIILIMTMQYCSFEFSQSVDDWTESYSGFSPAWDSVDGGTKSHSGFSPAWDSVDGGTESHSGFSPAWD